MISVLIVDDHPVVRQGLRALLEVQDDIMVVGEAGDGRAAVSLATSLSPDIVLLDLKLPGMDGVAALQPLSAAGLRVLVLTSATDPAAASQAVRAGAAGVLYKDIDDRAQFGMGLSAELPDRGQLAGRPRGILHDQQFGGPGVCPD